MHTLFVDQVNPSIVLFLIPPFPIFQQLSVSHLVPPSHTDDTMHFSILCPSFLFPLPSSSLPQSLNYSHFFYILLFQELFLVLLVFYFMLLVP
jgi:hypothetical protein